MSVKEQKINKLIHHFLTHNTITFDEIKMLLDISNRSVSYYIKDLRKLGYNIRRKNNNYVLVEDDYEKGMLLSNTDLRVIKILLTVGECNGRLEHRELVEMLKESLCDADVSVKRPLLGR
ncbi:MAG TPA: HTH domain-containing protein [Clostridia bacterium]|jgi:biotin operon repressor|nr:HTH domain-containing protein [Clostridiaceae bacterium]HPZ52629.1 HTH domain-containing protein [Clostridia bacterium]